MIHAAKLATLDDFLTTGLREIASDDSGNDSPEEPGLVAFITTSEFLALEIYGPGKRE